MSAFAVGKHAYGFCDRCGFRYDLKDLKYEMTDQRRNGLRVCPECMDIDHEQLQLGKFRIWDPEALKDPRPDLSLVSSRDMPGLPGHPPTAGLTLTAYAPTVVIA